MKNGRMLSAAMITLGLLLLAGCANGPPNEAEQWCLARDSGPPDRTIAGCTTLIQSDYNSPWIGFANRGQAHLRQRDYDLAIADLNEAIRLHPNWATPYNDRGVAYALKGRYEEAKADFNQAFTLDPVLVEALENRGKAYVALHDYDRGLTDLDHATKLSDSVILSPGTAWLQREQFDDASPSIRPSGISKAQIIADRYLTLASIHALTERYGLAEEEAAEAIRQNPSDPQGYFMKAVYEVHADKFDAALRDVNQSIATAPSSATAYNERCWIEMILGQLEPAEADCNKAIELRPGFALALDSRGWVRLKAGRLDDALADFSASLALNPVSSSSLYGRGVIERRKGNKSAGDADIALATQIRPGIIGQYAAFHP